MNNDLISRSELRKRFQAILDRGDMFCEYDIIGMVDNAPTVLHDNYSEGYQDGVRKVLSERPQGEWIPVSERLPDYMEDTLVTIQVNNREPKVRSGFYAHGYFHNDNGDTWNWNDPEVKAWMSLPKAYKEVDND